MNEASEKECKLHERIAVLEEKNRGSEKALEIARLDLEKSRSLTSDLQGRIVILEKDNSTGEGKNIATHEIWIAGLAVLAIAISIYAIMKGR